MCNDPKDIILYSITFYVYWVLYETATNSPEAATSIIRAIESEDARIDEPSVQQEELVDSPGSSIVYYAITRAMYRITLECV